MQISWHSPYVTHTGVSLVRLVCTGRIWATSHHERSSCREVHFFSLHSLMCQGMNLTCMEVMEAAWPCRTVIGAQVRRHHSLMTLSQLAEAMRVFSWLTAMSEISAAWPRSVARSRPSSVAQIFTKQSSEPWRDISQSQMRQSPGFQPSAFINLTCTSP